MEELTMTEVSACLDIQPTLGFNAVGRGEEEL